LFTSQLVLICYCTKNHISVRFAPTNRSVLINGNNPSAIFEDSPLSLHLTF